MPYSNASIEVQFARIVRMARSFGLDPQWELVHGRDRQGGTPRQPWRIAEGDLVLFNLGYTRRSAYDALTTIATVFDYLLTTENWKEDA